MSELRSPAIGRVFLTSIPALVLVLGRSELGSFVWRVHHEARPLIYLRPLPPGCTTSGPGPHPSVYRSHARTCGQVLLASLHFRVLRTDGTRTGPADNLSEPRFHFHRESPG